MSWRRSYRLRMQQMPIDPHIRLLTIKNYISLHNCTFPMRLVNVVGGMNGVGKTSLLEAVFLLLDRLDPVVLLRPAIFRNFPFDFERESRRMFWNGDTATPIEIRSKIRSHGKELIRISHGTIAPPMGATQVPSAINTPVSPTVQASTTGLNLECFIDGKPDGVVGYSVTPQGLMRSVNRPFSQSAVKGVMLTASNRYNPKDIADRFTDVVQSGNLQHLLDALRIVQPNLKTLQLLQVGGAQPQSLIHADVGVQNQIPINLLGDGALTIATIVMNTIAAANGVVLIDEFDASIHYSVLRKIWSFVAHLAATFNTQIIVSTHSRECIQAASDGLEDIRLSQNFNYTRLDLVGSEVTVTTYEPNELKAALEAEWEVR
jgi:ABC-type cobalamin/Fe3+-siderophores transport system ATPase subunit